mmetsp:Transcript_98851/g.235689  ORF Transcript_98851/g.235689 Transcript_98851/m.235689 type:complete len:233 (-) Transcript_98851:858-1556(-)
MERARHSLAERPWQGQVQGQRGPNGFTMRTHIFSPKDSGESQAFSSRTSMARCKGVQTIPNVQCGGVIIPGCGILHVCCNSLGSFSVNTKPRALATMPQKSSNPIASLHRSVRRSSSLRPTRAGARAVKTPTHNAPSMTFTNPKDVTNKAVTKEAPTKKRVSAATARNFLRTATGPAPKRSSGRFFRGAVIAIIITGYTAASTRIMPACTTSMATLCGKDSKTLDCTVGPKA